MAAAGGYPIDTPPSIWKTCRYRRGKAVDLTAEWRKGRKVSEGEQALLRGLGRREGAEALNRFLSLSSWEIEQQANRRARTSPDGTTWLSLSKLMQRNGYRIVGELGLPAAISWGVHLGVLPSTARPAPPVHDEGGSR